MMYNDKLVYKIVIWVFLGRISLWKEKEALIVFVIYTFVMDSVVIVLFHVYNSSIVYW